MRGRAALALAVVAAAIISVPPASAAPVGVSTASAHAPSPWGTYMGDVSRTGYNSAEGNLSPANVAELRPAWSVRTDRSDFSAPIEVGGTVYAGSWDGHEYAIGAANGTVLWRTFIGQAVCGYGPQGVSSTAQYVAGELYVGGGDGYWYALNASTGAVDWRYLIGLPSAGYYDWAGALVNNGSLYVGTASCYDNPLVRAGLLRLDVSGPAPRLAAEFNATPPGTVGESIWTTPALDPGANTVWVTTGNEWRPGYPRYANAVVGLNATTLNVTGSWQVGANVTGLDSDFGSTPALYRTAAGTPMVVATDKNGYAYALDRANVSASGSWGPSWSVRTFGGFSGAAFDGRRLFLAGLTGVRAVDPATGATEWAAPMDGGGDVIGSLAAANGVVYADGGNVVEAVASSNGTVLWNYSLPVGQRAESEPVVADGRLYVASGDYRRIGYLTAFSLPTPREHPVTVKVSGLPAGAGWSADVSGAGLWTRGTSLTFYESDGTYPYLVRPPAGYRVAGPAASGNVTVSGGPAVVSVSLVRGPTYYLYFVRNAVAPGTPWCVDVLRDVCSYGPVVRFAGVSPGSYPYSIGAVPGYRDSAWLRGSPVPESGWANVSARSVGVAVRFSPVTYAVTFTESGLAAGTRWGVRVDGVVNGAAWHSVRASWGTTVSFSLPNGTWAFYIGPVAGYSDPPRGALTVAGGPAAASAAYGRA
jgi:outer membrane protein assembly factor BamB